MKEKTLSVSAIKQGTVIDHIAANQALKIVSLLRLSENERRVTIGLNLKSRSMGLKDIIKLEDVFLSEIEAAQIAVFSPSATVNVIENHKVIQQYLVKMPSSIREALPCPNPRCITNGEKTTTLFTIEENNGLAILRCNYCEKRFSI